MATSDTNRLGALPNANGAISRLAYMRAKESGVDPQPLLKRANLTLHQIEDSKLRLRVRDQIIFLNSAAAALHDDLLGFHLAQSSDLRELGFLYYVSASSETLGDALMKVARYSAIANEGVSLKFISNKTIGIKFHYVGVSRHLDRHQIEFFMVVLVRLCRQLTGFRLIPTHVTFAHRENSECAELIEFFGANIEFGAANDEVSFAPTVKDMSIVSADHHLNKLLVTYCEEALSRRSANRSSFRFSVENAIVPLLPHGKVSINEIARRLGVSQRTFARRLALEGLTYSAVLESLKIDLANRYLADENLSISQIAWLLGYQEASSFTHAFKRWSDTTPRQARSLAAS